jgi:hypothetical protein
MDIFAPLAGPLIPHPGGADAGGRPTSILDRSVYKQYFDGQLRVNLRVPDLT